MSTKPRGYRSVEMPRDPARLLRALPNWRDESLAASGQVKIGCDLYREGHDLTLAIDAVAGLVTGDSGYFWFKGSGPTDGQRAEGFRWDAIERGEPPWPR